MTRDEYYMTIAMAVRKKANCLGRKVGAVIVRENRIISTGYNGTPEGMTNCLDGGLRPLQEQGDLRLKRWLRRMHLRTRRAERADHRRQIWQFH